MMDLERTTPERNAAAVLAAGKSVEAALRAATRAEESVYLAIRGCGFPETAAMSRAYRNCCAARRAVESSWRAMETALRIARLLESETQYGEQHETTAE